MVNVYYINKLIIHCHRIFFFLRINSTSYINFSKYKVQTYSQYIMDGKRRVLVKLVCRDR